MNNGDNRKSGNLEGGAWWQPSLILFARFSSWIVFPILVASFLGKWLDNKYESEPWFFLSLISFSFFISMFGLIKEVGESYRKINKDEDESKNLKNKSKK